MLIRLLRLLAPDEPSSGGGDAQPAESAGDTNNAGNASGVPGAGASTGAVSAPAPEASTADAADDGQDDDSKALEDAVAKARGEDVAGDDNASDEITLTDDQIDAILSAEATAAEANAAQNPDPDPAPAPAPKAEDKAKKPEPKASDAKASDAADDDIASLPEELREVVSEFEETKPMAVALVKANKAIEALTAKVEAMEKAADINRQAAEFEAKVKPVMDLMDEIPGLNAAKFGDSRKGPITPSQLEHRAALEKKAIIVARKLLAENPVDITQDRESQVAHVRRIEAAAVEAAHRFLERKPAGSKPEATTTKSAVIASLRHQSKTRSPAGLPSTRTTRTSQDDKVPYDDDDDGPTAIAKVLRARGIPART